MEPFDIDFATAIIATGLNAVVVIFIPSTLVVTVTAANTINAGNTATPRWAYGTTEPFPFP